MYKTIACIKTRSKAVLVLQTGRCRCSFASRRKPEELGAFLLSFFIRWFSGWRRRWTETQWSPSRCMISRRRFWSSSFTSMWWSWVAGSSSGSGLSRFCPVWLWPSAANTWVQPNQNQNQNHISLVLVYVYQISWGSVLLSFIIIFKCSIIYISSYLIIFSVCGLSLLVLSHAF